MRALVLLPLVPFLLLSLPACNVGLSGGRRRDAGAAPFGDAGVPSAIVCDSPAECPDGLSCIGGLCAAPAPTCGPCPAPGVCRGDVCVTPSATGSPCEFDEECAAGELCVGVCTHDPREPLPCTSDEACAGAGALACVENVCGCIDAADCPSGFECDAGACIPGGDCVAEADCVAGMVCAAGECIDRAVCEALEPNLAREWEMSSELSIRDALSPGFSSLMDRLERVFRVLAGEIGCRDIGWSTAIEVLACPYLDAALDRLPPWARTLFGALANVNTLLSTWHVEERMVLTSTGTENQYTGTRVWDRVRFVSRTTMLEVDPREIADLQFEVEPFLATASCGVLSIARHDVDFSFGAVVIWIVNAIIQEASDRRYGSLREGADALIESLCADLSDAVGGTSAPLVEVACLSELEDELDEVVAAIESARLDVPLRLRGSAVIEDARNLRPGTWQGRLIGGDFDGTFEAWW